jgi:phosphomannomutase
LKVFGTAGIRGVFNRSQTLDQIHKVAETTAFVFGRGDYSVAWDGRKSSFILANVIISAVTEVGSNVIVFGMIPTPVLAFGTREAGCLSGFSVTASHNPPEFSGVKIFNPKGMELDEEDEMKIERVLALEFAKNIKDFGRITFYEDIIDNYIDALLLRFEPAKKKLKIVVDCVNSPGAFVTPNILEKLGHKVLAINSQISWLFPAREPEPTSESLRDVANIVVSLGADLGFAHDSDADRIVMLNSFGQVVPDSIISIIMMKSLGQESGSIILSENCSSAVEEEAERLGLHVIRSKIGKTFTLLEKENAIFASEPSKIVDPRWGLWEDGIYSAALIANAISDDSSLRDLANAGVGWYYRQVSVPFVVDFTDLKRVVEEEFSKFRISEKREIDGLKLIFKDESWIMFRQSGTESKTRIYCETRDKMKLEELLQVGMKCVENLRMLR